jgi:hypothetical protein
MWPIIAFVRNNTPLARKCAGCQSVFEAPRRVGKPNSYCSMECRSQNPCKGQGRKRAEQGHRFVAGNHGYVYVKAYGHPMSGKSGWAYEHRMIVHAANSGICPPCFWCASPLSWSECHIDHLNENRTDNSIKNLRVSCSMCNRSRGCMLPFIQRMTPLAFSEFITAATELRG